MSWPDPRRVTMRVPEFLLRNPHFCLQFKDVVPESFLLRGATGTLDGVRCHCGETYEMRLGELVECSTGPHRDGLLRTFLRTDTSIRVAKWEPVG